MHHSEYFDLGKKSRLLCEKNSESHFDVKSISDESSRKKSVTERVRVLKSRARSSPSLDSSSKIEYESAKKCRVRVESMPSLDSDPSLIETYNKFLILPFLDT